MLDATIRVGQLLHIVFLDIPGVVMWLATAAAILDATRRRNQKPRS